MRCFFLVLVSKRKVATPRGLANKAWLGVRKDTHFYIFLGFIGSDPHCPASRRDATQSPLMGVWWLVAQSIYIECGYLVKSYSSQNS